MFYAAFFPNGYVDETSVRIVVMFDTIAERRHWIRLSTAFRPSMPGFRAGIPSTSTRLSRSERDNAIFINDATFGISDWIPGTSTLNEEADK